MNNQESKVKQILIGVVMLFAALISILVKPSKLIAPQNGKLGLEIIIPKKFSEWNIDESITPFVNPDLKKSIDKIYSDTLSRTYVNLNGKHIMLSIAYGANQSDTMRIHQPQGCYTGQGFAVTDPIIGNLQLSDEVIKVKRLIAKKFNRFEPVTYWMVVGGELVLSEFQAKLVQIKHGFNGSITDGILVRVSTVDIADVKEAYSTEESFVLSLISSIKDEERKLLIGG